MTTEQLHRLPVRIDTAKVDTASSPAAKPVAVLTGATRGIGRGVASRIVAAGHVLILPGRNQERNEKLCRDLALEAPGAEVYWVECDLSSLASVREAAAKISAATNRVDVLVNNAGHFGGARKDTDDGFESHLAINYLAPFVLTHGLMGVLRNSGAARIVNVAGETARLACMRMNDLNRRSRFSVLGAYAQSKLAMLLFTRVLAARVSDSSMLVNALQPGVAATGHLSAGPRWLDRLWRFITPGPERAAMAVARLALAPRREGTSGRYYIGRLRAFAPFAVYRRGLARALYEKTIELVGLAPELRLNRIGDGL